MSDATIRRLADRAGRDRSDLDAVLDADISGVLSTTADDGTLSVVPILYARDGDRLLLHGSSGAGTLRLAASGREVCLCVTIVDALVYATTLFDSSANYRSAVVYGTGRPLEGDAKYAALTAIAEHLMPGRAAETRGHTAKELAATLVVELPIGDRWACKTRHGGVGEDTPEPDTWSGIVPLTRRWEAPQPTPGAPPVPASVDARLARPL